MCFSPTDSDSNNDEEGTALQKTEKNQTDNSEETSKALAKDGNKTSKNLYVEKFTDLFTNRILLKHAVIAACMW